MAVLALSPGINKPFNAIMCIERLAEAFARLVERRIPSPYRSDDKARLRVIAPPFSFPDLLAAGLDQIRYHSSRTPAVMLSLLGALHRIAARTTKRASRSTRAWCASRPSIASRRSTIAGESTVRTRTSCER